MKSTTPWANQSKQNTAWTPGGKNPAAFTPVDTPIPTQFTANDTPTPTHFGPNFQDPQTYFYNDANMAYNDPLIEYNYLVNNNQDNQRNKTAWSAT